MEWVSDDKLDYLDRFGLEKEPFTPEVDSVSFFQDAVISQRLGMLQHFSRYSDLLLLVVGEHGAGKTTLLTHFIAQLDEEIKVSRVEASPGMGRDGLLIAIGKGFGLPPILEGDISTFIKQLQELLRFDEGGLLVIDDAHLLPADTLHYALELAEISGSHGKLLRVILFAEPGIEQLLAEPGLAKLGERITHTLDTPPFDLERTEAYIRHRMSAAGQDGEGPFDKAEVKRIHKASHGNPLRINELAQEHLLEMAADPEGRRRRPLKQVYLATIAVLVMVAVSSVVMLNQGPRKAPQVSTSEDGRTVTLPLNQAKTSPPPRLKGWHEETPPGEESAPPPTVAPASKGQEPVPVPEPGQGKADTPAEAMPTPVNSQITAQQSAQAQDSAAPLEAGQPAQEPTPLIKSVSPEPVVGSPRRQSITVHGSDFDPKAKVTVGWTGKTRELDNWQVRVVSEEQIVFRVITGTQGDTWTVRVVNPRNHGSNVYSFHVVSPKSPQATQVTLPKEKAKPTTSDSQWLFDRDPKHYTLQVLASRNGLAVANYYKDRGLEGRGHILAYRKDGQQWYGLVYGDYASHEAADAAAVTLAEQLKDDNKPWSRSMAGLQQMVLAGRIENAAWIKVQSGSFYTLQLVAGSSRETVEAFVGEHRLTGQAAVYQTTHQGQPWYVLIYGLYDDQGQAQAAAAALPPEVRKMKPWARSLASVQQDIP